MQEKYTTKALDLFHEKSRFSKKWKFKQSYNSSSEYSFARLSIFELQNQIECPSSKSHSRKHARPSDYFIGELAHVFNN